MRRVSRYTINAKAKGLFVINPRPKHLLYLDSTQKTFESHFCAFFQAFNYENHWKTNVASCFDRFFECGSAVRVFHLVLFAWQSSIWYVYENSVDLLCGHAYTARFMELSTPNFWAAVTTCGSQHRATRGSCVEECVEENRSRFHGSQHRLSQSVDGVHGEAARAARMRSAWMSGWGWELFWTLNSAVFKGFERCMKQACTLLSRQ